MAALQVNSVDQEASPSEVRYLLEFAKYQKENPELDTDQAAKSFLGVVHPFQSPFSEKIQRSSAIQIHRDLATPTLSKPESCPQTSSMSLAGSQRMTRGNSNQTSPQHAFAMRAGRSPQQFTNTIPVTAFSSSFPETPRTNIQYATGPPSFQALQSLGIDSVPALQEYLGQNDRHEPFPLLRHAVGDSSFGETRTNKGYPSLTIDPTLESFSAPQMRPQLSSSASEYFTGGDEGYLDSPHSISYPMGRHSRSFSHGSFNSSLFSSSQAESASPTDPYIFGQHGGSNSMSRQASGTSFIHGGLSMLRVQSSTGSSGDANDSIGGVYGGTNHDINNLLCGIGHFATEGGDLSSLNKASAQVVLKRSSSVSVDDLNDSMAVVGGQAEYYSPSASSNGQSKSRKQRRVKEEESEEVAVAEEQEGDVNCLHKKKTSSAKQQGTKAESEATTKPNIKPTTSRTSERKSHGGSARPLPTIKPGKNPNSPPLATSKSFYIRPPHPRVHCSKCNAHPEGFRGDHELRRHTDREHAPTRKMYVIKDISKGKTLLAKCKACQSGKKYGVDYNAAAHLRRQHFKPKTRNGKNKQKVTTTTLDHAVPEMAELRKWMIEVEVEVPKDQDSYYKRGRSRESGDGVHVKGEDEGDTSEENDEEETQQVDGDTTYHEAARHKIQQQDTLEFMQGIELEVDSASGQPQTDFTWTCNKWSNSAVNNATYTLSNPKMPQHLTHHFGSHVSATTGSTPLIVGGLNQQNIAIHLPAQHQMLMQDNLHLQQLPYFTHESCTTGSFGDCLPVTGARPARFNDDSFGPLTSGTGPEIFPELENDITPF